tara:strand:- start:57 stop:758 length:702 start_codon:yes stop_codon:yes gene_type:complete
MKNIIIIFGILFLSNLAEAHTCDPQKVKCPIDKTTVEFCVTMSMSSFGSYYDFQKQGEIGNHYEELINSCPKCHFSGYLSDFEKKYSKEQKSRVKNFLEKYDNVEINDSKECEIAGKIKEFLKESNDDISNCYLIGSYLIRLDSTQNEYRKQLQTNTLIHLQKAIENKEYEDSSVIATINYLIGEMYRRTSDFENAIIHFDLAISDENKKDWVEEVAIKQKELAIKADDDNSI